MATSDKLTCRRRSELHEEQVAGSSKMRRTANCVGFQCNEIGGSGCGSGGGKAGTLLLFVQRGVKMFVCINLRQTLMRLVMWQAAAATSRRSRPATCNQLACHTRHNKNWRLTGHKNGGNYWQNVGVTNAHLLQVLTNSDNSILKRRRQKVCNNI